MFFGNVLAKAAAKVAMAGVTKKKSECVFCTCGGISVCVCLILIGLLVSSVATATLSAYHLFNRIKRRCTPQSLVDYVKTLIPNHTTFVKCEKRNSA